MFTSEENESPCFSMSKDNISKPRMTILGFASFKREILVLMSFSFRSLVTLFKDDLFFKCCKNLSADSSLVILSPESNPFTNDSIYLVVLLIPNKKLYLIRNAVTTSKLLLSFFDLRLQILHIYTVSCTHRKRDTQKTAKFKKKNQKEKAKEKREREREKTRVVCRGRIIRKSAFFAESGYPPFFFADYTDSEPTITLLETEYENVYHFTF